MIVFLVNFRCLVKFRCFALFMRDAYMHSAYLLSKDGCLSGCLSHAGIVSKRLKISNFFINLVALPLWFSNTALLIVAKF